MPKPSTRAELLNQVTVTYRKLKAEVRNIVPGADALVCVDQWSIKDLLAIRAWWTHAVIDWTETGRLDKALNLPAPGYRWNETPRLNADIVNATSDDSFETVLCHLDNGFNRVLVCIDGLTDHELLDVGVFQWAGKWPISRWVSINTGRQYTTARTYIRRCLRDHAGK